MAKKTRLDKFLCDSLNMTRKEAKESVKKGKVVVNGEVMKKPEYKVDAEQDQVEFDHKLLQFEQFHYLMLHKPQGVVSATKDHHDQTVLDLIHEDYKDRLFPVGRLDKDTEGLLLLTDDGMLAHELLSPRKHVDKVYFAKVSGQFGENEIDRFKEGLDIGNGERSKQARLQILKADVQESEVLITIMEGKFHQVKRMVKAVGSEVLYLKRLSMGSLKLDEELKLGEYRRLTKAELQELKELRRYMLENKKAVIFDLDGTLVDSMWIWREIDIRFLGKYGLEVPQGLNDKLEGYSFHETAVYFKEHFPLPLTIEEIMGTWNRMASEIYINEIRLKEGVKEFIELLKKRNMKLGIATSNSRKLAKDCLRSNGILDAFDYICTSDEVPRSKPEPDVYLHAAKMIDTRPKDALVFEDIPYGILAGKRAGMEVCAVKDPYSQGSVKEKKEIADYYINTYYDILDGTYEVLKK